MVVGFWENYKNKKTKKEEKKPLTWFPVASSNTSKVLIKTMLKAVPVLLDQLLVPEDRRINNDEKRCTGTKITRLCRSPFLCCNRRSRQPTLIRLKAITSGDSSGSRSKCFVSVSIFKKCRLCFLLTPESTSYLTEIKCTIRETWCNSQYNAACIN